MRPVLRPPINKLHAEKSDDSFVIVVVVFFDIHRCLSILKFASFEYSRYKLCKCVKKRAFKSTTFIYLPERLPLESQKWLCISALASLNPLQK